MRSVLFLWLFHFRCFSSRPALAGFSPAAARWIALFWLTFLVASGGSSEVGAVPFSASRLDAQLGESGSLRAPILGSSLAGPQNQKLPFFRSSVGLTAYQYLNPVLLGGTSGIAALNASFRIDSVPTSPRDPWVYDLELHSVGSTYFSRAEQSIWMEMAELSLGWKTQNSALVFGRKRQPWSSFDEVWGLGLWQPRLRWDYLQVGQVGLTGAFWNWRPSRSLQLMAFASPLSLPERGPEVALREGVLVPSNGWPGSPPTRVPLNGIATDVRYSIAMPPIAQLLLQPSLGGRVAFGPGSEAAGSGSRLGQGPWVAAAYAYKPIPQPVLAFDGYFNLDAGVADAVIHPRIAHHHLAQVEGGVRSPGAPWTAFWASVAREEVRVPVAEPAWTSQGLSDSWFFSAGSTLKIGSYGSLDLSVLRRAGRRDTDVGPQATPGSSVFEPRHLFERAVSAAWSLPVPGFNPERVTLRSRWVHEWESSGTLLGAQLSIRPHAGWNLLLGADVLGADPARAAGASDFIARYRAHDRVYGGLSYVF
jgi:hypothetical protein